MQGKNRFNRIRAGNQAGFTLIEILIVVILLGILATIIIPQVSISTDDAKLNTLKTNLNNIRGAVELYYYQHGNKYPGQVDVDGSSAPADAAAAAAAFKAQLTRYTDKTGKTAVTKDATYKYGPYLRDGLPSNPINESNDIVCDIAEDDITVKASSETTKGWKFYIQTGILLANDGANDSL